MAVESFNRDPTFDPNQNRSLASRSGKRSHRISDELRREIVLGLLAPREVLLELELAERFGCSQSTVREALLALQEEGLVVRMSHRGTQVAECLRDDMIELIRLRHDIETRGIVKVIVRYDRLMHRALSGIVDQMIAAARADDEYGLSVLDRRFHLRIYEEAGLHSIEPMLLRCLIPNHRYMILNTTRQSSLLVTAERPIPCLVYQSYSDAHLTTFYNLTLVLV